MRSISSLKQKLIFFYFDLINLKIRIFLSIRFKIVLKFLNLFANHYEISLSEEFFCENFYQNKFNLYWPTYVCLEDYPPED